MKLKNIDKIIITIIISIILYLIIKKRRSEGFENTGMNNSMISLFDNLDNKLGNVVSSADENSININKTLNVQELKSSGKIEANNISVNGTLTASDISVRNGVTTKGTISAKKMNVSDQICIGNDCFTKAGMQKLMNLSKIGGYAIDGDGSTHLLLEGKRNLTNETWSNDRWDIIYLFKGWQITLYEQSNARGKTQFHENKNSDFHKVDLNIVGHNKASFYDLKWVGY